VVTQWGAWNAIETAIVSALDSVDRELIASFGGRTRRGFKQRWVALPAAM